MSGKLSTTSIIEKKLSTLRFVDRSAVADADTHISDPSTLPEAVRRRIHESRDYFQGRPLSAEELITSMDRNGITMSLCWQNPAVTPYTGDPEADYLRLLEANRYIHASERRFPDRLIPAGWTDPKALGEKRALRMVELCVVEFGFPIVKLNPAQNGYRIDDERVFRITDHIVELGAVPAFHFGADTPFTPPDGLEQVARRYPDYPLIAVHMGGGGAAYLEAENHYHQARELGLAYPNIRFVLSAKRDTHMESDIRRYEEAGEPWNRNLFCASDAPYGLQSWNYGGFRALMRDMDLPEESARRYLGRNMLEFTIEAYERLFAKSHARAGLTPSA